MAIRELTRAWYRIGLTETKKAGRIRPSEKKTALLSYCGAFCGRSQSPVEELLCERGCAVDLAQRFLDTAGIYADGAPLHVVKVEAPR